MIVGYNLLHLPVAKPDNSVSQGGNSSIVGNDHNRRMVIAAETGQQFENLLPGPAVQSSGRLVTEQKRRIFAEGPCNGNSLLFAAGKLRRKVIHPLRQPDIRYHLNRVQRIGAYLSCQLHVLQRCKVVHQVIKLKNKSHIKAPVICKLPVCHIRNYLTAYSNPSRADPVHTSQEIQDRRLSGPAVPKDHTQLAFFD